jgi:hypothetical protein
MKEIDMSKMKMNFDKLQLEKEIKDAMKNINMDEIKKSMEELKKINFDDVKKQMEQVKKEMALNKDHFKVDMEKLKSEMEKAKMDMLRAKEEMGEVKEMVGELEKDGLLNKNENNSIEYKNKELFINGKKQSAETTEKYKKYFKGDNIKFNFNWN